MLLLSKNQLKFFFSLNAKFYDVICIGHSAQKVAKLAQKYNKKISFKKLFVKSSDIHYQSNLAIFGQSQISIKQNYTQNIDTKLRNQIYKIDPSKNILILKNGQEIKFKHLIFSGQDHQWKNINCIKGLKEGLQSQFTDTYADIKGSNPQKLYSKINSDIYFNISSQRHFGVDNLFMIHLADSLKKLAKIEALGNSKNIKIKILNKSDKIIPSNQELDQQIKRLLNQNDIQIMSNINVEEINHKTRLINVKKNGKIQSLKYGAFYQYLPFKIPDFLAQSGINPLNIDAKTLLNNQYPTIHTIGNIFHNLYSFYTVNYIAHIMARNIVNLQFKSNNRALYLGESAIPFWTGLNSLRYFAFNNKGPLFFNNMGSNKYTGNIWALDRKLFATKQVSAYYNGSSYGLPYYVKSPKLKQDNQTINHVKINHDKILSF